LFLRLELIKVLFILLSLIIGFFFGLNAMLLSMGHSIENFPRCCLNPAIC
jgi:hypothetical protein